MRQLRAAQQGQATEERRESKRLCMQQLRAAQQGQTTEERRESECLRMRQLRAAQQGQATEERWESECLRMRQLRAAQQGQARDTTEYLLYYTSACHPTHSLRLAPTMFCIHLVFNRSSTEPIDQIDVIKILV